MARSTKLPTILFDEIDTGVSGKIADAMGRIIADLGAYMQVVNICLLYPSGALDIEIILRVDPGD